MKKIVFYSVALMIFFVSPILNANAALCPSNITPDLQLLDPACWTSVYVSSGYWQSCSWNTSGAICDNVDSKGNWAGSVFNAGSCSDCPKAKYNTCHGNNYVNSCTGATHCDNAGPLPSAGGGWVDNSYYNNNCYYTKPVSWGAPAVDGLILATDVDTFSTSGTVCSNDPNFKYADAIPVLEVNGSGSAVTVNRANPIDISWSSTYATSCTVPASNTGVGWAGAKAISGGPESKDISFAPKPTSAGAAPTVLNYQISCTNPGGVQKIDSVPVTVTCTPDLTPAWSACDKNCGPGNKTRTVRYANCFETVTVDSCNDGDCPVSSEWKEVRP